MQVPGRTTPTPPKEDLESELTEERKKSRALAAENARLTFKLQVSKTAFDVEKKQLWQNVAAEKMEHERLEQEVFRLARKLMAAEKQLQDCAKADTTGKLRENLNPFKPSPTARTSPLKGAATVRNEESENLVYRTAPFEYTVVPNPNAPATASREDKRRIEQLEEQLKIYRVLLEQGNELRDGASVQNKLRDAGLHKDAPFRRYVSPEYYTYTQKGGTGPAAYGQGVSTPRQHQPVGFGVGGFQMINPEDIIWDDIPQ